ncbi:MAG: hypothetical protein J07HN6_00056 [Halonotius sp. J07HN6]|jgi:hypothetical protein|nr:MAG: hypothetical protein J07HN6_00056 [Halonotius sp. J07HN6]
MKPSAANDGLQIVGDDASTGEHAVVATLEQLFTGLRVGMPSLDVQCSGYGAHLGEAMRSPSTPTEL